MTFFAYFIQYKKNQDKSALQYCDTIIKSFCLVGMPEYGEELQKFKDKFTLLSFILNLNKIIN